MRMIARLPASLAAALLAMTSPGHAQQGVSDSEILLGEVEPLTGPPGLLGIAHNIGVRLAIEEANADGGVAGRKLKLIAEDDGYVTSRTIQSLRKLINVDKVFAITAVSGSGQAVASLPVLKQSGIPTMIPIGPLPPLYEPPLNNVFVVGQSYSEGMRQLALYLAKKNPGAKWGVITQDDDYGKALREGIEQAGQDAEISIAFETKYARGQKDFSSEMLKVKDAGVDVLVAGGIISENIAMVKEAEKLGIKPVIATFWPGRVPEVLKAIGPASDGLYAVDYVAPLRSDEGAKFIELAKKYLPAEEVARINRYTMTGYASTRALIGAMKACASDLTWACTIKALENGAPVETGVLAPVDFPEGKRFSDQKVQVMRADYETLSYEPVE